MLNDSSEDGQSTDLIFSPYMSALQVTLTIAIEVIHLNTAWDAALDWTKINKWKLFQNLLVYFLQCSATGNLQNCIYNSSHWVSQIN